MSVMNVAGQNKFISHYTMEEFICNECFHNSYGNCNEGCADYMDTDYCDKFVENEDIGPLEEDLGEDYLDDGISK